LGALAGHLIGKGGGPREAQPEGQLFDGGRFLIQSERALVIASGYLVEKNAPDTVKTAVRYLLRWVIQDRRDGIVRLSPGIAGLMCLISCGLATAGDPNFASRLGTEMMSAVGSETFNTASGGLVSALISRLAAGQELREAVISESQARRAEVGASIASQLDSLIDWSNVKCLPSAAVLGFSDNEYDDSVMKGIASALIHTTSYREGVTAAANHHGAVLAATLAGALLGASLGERGILQECLSPILDRDEAVHVTESLRKTFGPAR
jgi:hypothetical protein